MLLLSLNSCGLLFGLFYHDWTQKKVYKSAISKKEYYTIEAATQSHCGCSDLIVRGFVKKEPSFIIYYGGGLFEGKKYQFIRQGNRIDTITYKLSTSNMVDIPFDSLELAIFKRLDSLIQARPRVPGLVYNVKKHAYTGYYKIH